jgi:hypothetical protein
MVSHQLVPSIVMACSGQLATAILAFRSSSAGTPPSPISWPLPTSSETNSSGTVD